MTQCLEQDAFENDVLNIGSDIEYQIINLARLVIDIAGSKSEIQFLPPLPDGDMSRRQPDISKMRSLLKRELVTIEQGINKLIDHYRGQCEK